jgi:hypothetical protein
MKTLEKETPNLPKRKPGQRGEFGSVEEASNHKTMLASKILEKSNVREVLERQKSIIPK